MKLALNVRYFTDMFPLEEAAKIAADYTALCIRKTYEDPSHWYGVKFETALGDLIRMLEA